MRFSPFRPLLGLCVILWLTTLHTLLSADSLSAADPQTPPAELAHLYRATAPNVVMLAAFCGEEGVRMGAGVRLSRQELVLTSRSLLRMQQLDRPAERIIVYSKPPSITGKRKQDFAHHYDAFILHENPEMDLAILLVRSPRRNEAAPAFRLEKEKPSSSLSALGYHADLGPWSMLKVTGDTLPALPGFLGAPLFDDRGRLAGVLTASESPSFKLLPLASVRILKWLNLLKEKRISVITTETASPSEEKDRRDPWREGEQRVYSAQSLEKRSPNAAGDKRLDMTNADPENADIK